MAYAILRQGDIPTARELFQEGIRGMQKADLLIGLVFAVEGLASLYVHEAQLERAVRLFAWTEAMRENMGDPRPPVEKASIERDLAVIHSKLDDAEFANFTAEGRTMTVEQAIASALEENTD